MSTTLVLTPVILNIRRIDVCIFIVESDTTVGEIYCINLGTL